MTPTQPPSYQFLDDNLDTSPIALRLLTTPTSPQQTPPQTTPQTTPQATPQTTPLTPLPTPSPLNTTLPPNTPPPNTSPPPPPPPSTSQHPMVTRSKVGIVKANPKYNFHVTTSSPIPKSPFHALRDPNWKQAMCDEYKALIDNKTWVLVPRPPNVNIVRSMWLYKHKYNADGSVNIFRARKAAGGCRLCRWTRGQRRATGNGTWYEAEEVLANRSKESAVTRRVRPENALRKGRTRTKIAPGSGRQAEHVQKAKSIHDLEKEESYEALAPVPSSTSLVMSPNRRVGEDSNSTVKQADFPI
ncbi:ribonuclease H-like domain-containing protein [Tanacetum coccineum]